MPDQNRSVQPRVMLMLSEAWTMLDARDLRQTVDAAVTAERAGIDGVLLGEHIAVSRKDEARGVADNPREWVRPGNHLARAPHPHPLHVLSAIASVTTDLRLVASALLTALRHPLTIAKELATLDLLSRGRLVYMPVPASLEEECTALNVPFRERGKIFDEQLEIWERAWRDDYVSYSGRYFEFQDMGFEPKPWRSTGPTMWIGANRLHRNALRRLVRYGSGYFPVSPASDAELQEMRMAFSAAGRSIDEIEMIGFLGQTTAFPDASSTKPLGPTLDASLTEIERGVTTFVIKPSQFIDDPADLGDFCREVVAGLRERFEAARLPERQTTA